MTFYCLYLVVKYGLKEIYMCTKLARGRLMMVMDLRYFSHILRWLILYIYFTWLRDAQRRGKTLFLSVSVRVVLEEISTRLSKDHPPQCRWASSTPLRAWQGWKGGGRVNLLFAWAQASHLPLSLDIRHQRSWFSGFWTWTWTHTVGFPGSQAFRLRWNHHPAFLVLQLAGSRS